MDKGKDVKGPQTKTVSILFPREFKQKVQEDTPIFPLVAKFIASDLPFEFESDLLVKVEPLLREFGGMFLKDLPDEFPPMRDMHHAIDLVLGATHPNLPHYKMNPTEYAKLKR